MKIFVVSSTGEGSTNLSAFDNALYKANIHDYNLIVLSSVIPYKAGVLRVSRYLNKKKKVGDRLYLVMSNQRSNVAGKVIGAALGWYKFKDGGVFVEHEASGNSKEMVEKRLYSDVEDSLKDLCTHRGIKFQTSQMNIEMSISKVGKHPNCVLVAAVYKSEGW